MSAMAMAFAAPAPASGGQAPTAGSDGPYESGVCNIGPAEIAYRRLWGHIGLLVTLLAFLGLVWIDAPPAARFLIAIPAAGSAIGYLQALFRFCVAFGAMGVFNFGRLGSTQRVSDPALRRRDRARAWEVVLTSLLVGIVAGAVAVLLPI
jgi:hypothetical protein